MEPRIQYTRTVDGRNIAFWTLGEGNRFVYLPGTFTHVQLEWQSPGRCRWYERLAEKRKLVRYDARGTGLSDRDVTDFSLASHLLDLEAVMDRLGPGRSALFGSYYMGPVAIAYAVRHPERVSNLILWCSFARGSDRVQSPQTRALRRLLGENWELWTETVAHASMGWSEGEPARDVAALLRESTTPEAAQAIFRAADQSDVAALLPQVTSPTLVLHRRQYPLLDVDVGRDLASRIPNARLTILEGESLAPYVGDTDAVLRAIHDFLREGEAYPNSLTRRELEVLRLIAAGKSNREIANGLVISTNTVDRHVSNILAKTGASNRAEAASYAVRRGIA